MAGKRNLSTFDVANMLQVDPGSVANWIDGGLLKAHRTPGGHRRVTNQDLLEFLRAHQMPIPSDLQPRAVRVVVVDDEPAMTELVERALKTAHPDYEVISAQDGFRAGSLVATLHPDVVILDLRMPGMDGFEVCRLIKSQEDTRNAVVIAITAYPSEESTQRALQCGARRCMSKPLRLDELVAEVDAVIAELRG